MTLPGRISLPLILAMLLLSEGFTPQGRICGASMTTKPPERQGRPGCGDSRRSCADVSAAGWPARSACLCSSSVRPSQEILHLRIDQPRAARDDVPGGGRRWSPDRRRAPACRVSRAVLGGDIAAARRRAASSRNRPARSRSPPRPVDAARSRDRAGRCRSSGAPPGPASWRASASSRGLPPTPLAIDLRHRILRVGKAGIGGALIVADGLRPGRAAGLPVDHHLREIELGKPVARFGRRLHQRDRRPWRPCGRSARRAA